MTEPQEALERSLEIYASVVREHPALREELESSLREFFGGPMPAGTGAAALHHARRHLEWFLLERHSPTLFGIPAERLIDVWRERAGGDPTDEALASLLQSFSGVFQVTGRVGDGAWLRDLAGLGDYPLARPGVQLREGDLLVGRLHPTGEGVHLASPAVGLFRDPRLAEAVERDLERTRSGAGAKVLRLSQLELERLFWGAGRTPVAEDPVGEAREVLLEQGLSPARVEEALARLAAHPCDPEQVVIGAGDTLGEVLDELAFETDVDLERVRLVLTAAWPALSAPSKAPSPADSSREAEKRDALASFDAGRAAGRDLDELFEDLSRNLGLDEGAAIDPDEHEPAPDFPGVVPAMIGEFRWEVERFEGREAAARHEPLEALAEYAARLGRFDELDREHLLRFTTFWLPERGGLDAGRARALLDSLAAFCRWAEEAHELPLESRFAETLENLRESLPRVMELNRMLPAAPEDETGELYAVRADVHGRFDGVVDREGRMHQAHPEPSLAARLRAGDRLRGSISLEGELAVFRCYPPEAAGLTA